jgi:branched-subunit amino acid aminotransferase/4-amino-4-deoxychorismate lyase
VLTERSITVDELLAADEIALVSSARGWRTARLVRPVQHALGRGPSSFRG